MSAASFEDFVQECVYFKAGWNSHENKACFQRQLRIKQIAIKRSPLHLEFGLELPHPSPGQDLDVRGHLLAGARLARSHLDVTGNQLVAAWNKESVP